MNPSGKKITWGMVDMGKKNGSGSTLAIPIC